MASIGFLHTAAAHVATFTALVPAGVAAVHAVRPDLLARARTTGIDADLRAEVRAALQGLGGEVVVCTCSTIGSVAEEEGKSLGRGVLRVDRPMADAAVALGGTVMVVAALDSTVEPTCALLREAAAGTGAQIAVDVVMCPEAWPHFEAGDLRAYHRAVADAVLGADGCDVVVLAQASMAGAAPLLGHLGVPVLSSPAAAVRAALSMLA